SLAQAEAERLALAVDDGLQVAQEGRRGAVAAEDGGRRTKQLRHLVDDLGGHLVLVGDHRTGNPAVDQLRVPDVRQNPGPDADAAGVETNLVEVGAGNIEAGLLLASFGLRLSLAESDAVVDCGEVRTLGEADAAPGDV